MATEPRAFQDLTPVQRDLVRLQFGEDLVVRATAWIFREGFAFMAADPRAPEPPTQSGLRHFPEDWPPPPEPIEVAAAELNRLAGFMHDPPSG